MTATVYVETSVISHLTSRPSRDLVAAAMQTITQEWWLDAHNRYDLRVSVLVLEEASRGDPEAARLRLDAISNLSVLALNEPAEKLARLLLEKKLVPQNSVEDAFHISIASAHGIDYLVTWNFRHINNAETRWRIQMAIESMGYACPTICSPEELGGFTQ
jgi:predicted nucleic acid-binding protein